MDLALNNLQRLICHKTQTTNRHNQKSTLTIKKIKKKEKKKKKKRKTFSQILQKIYLLVTIQHNLLKQSN